MDPLNPTKIEVAFHEAGHAVMGLTFGLRIKKTSLIGTDEYRGVTSFEPFERKDTFEHAEREIMLNLAGFVGEGLFLENKIKINPPHHPELVDSIAVVRDLLGDDRFRAFASGLPDLYPRTLTMIVDPIVRVYINYILERCFSRMIPLKSAIELIAKELSEKDELSGDYLSNLFETHVQSKQGLIGSETVLT